MGEALAILHSPTLHRHHPQLPFTAAARLHEASSSSSSSRVRFFKQNHLSCNFRVISAVSISKVPTHLTVASAGGQGVEIQPDLGGDCGDFGSSGGGKGGGGERGSNNSNEGEGHKKGMSMSQKLTLAYAALVGVGGVMGYMKSGSQKSLMAGGLSSLLLCYVYTVLPSRPVLASSLGLGVSAALLGVMGSRFKKSGKVFPAGVVSFVSLVMTGGYLHGILRSLH